jgi:hypothetical protein
MWKEGGRDRKGGIYCLNVLSKIFRPPAWRCPTCPCPEARNLVLPLHSGEGTQGRFRLCPSREEKRHFSGPKYVERRSLWAEKIHENNPLLDFEYCNGKKVRSLNESLGRAFCSTQTLLERPNSWRHNFLKILPPKLFWKGRPLDFGL